MNKVFCDIDYKRPLGGKDDFRTSTYRGHRYIDGTMPDMKLNLKLPETKIYHEDPLLLRTRVSDYKDNYVWQYVSPGGLRNPTLGKKVEFLKPYAEKLNYYMARPLKPAQSVMQSDYVPKTAVREPIIEPIKMPNAAKTTPIVIERMEHSASKYLDPAATTMRLDYCARTAQQVMSSIAAHDNITFWNWHEHFTPAKRVFPGRDVQQCDYYPAKDCVKRRREFPSLLKRVPNTGMTTEVRQNYQEPYQRALDYDNTDMRNCITHVPAVPFADQTDAKIIGSGDRIQKYI